MAGSFNLEGEHMNSNAFQVTAADISNVLAEYSLRVTDTQGKSFETIADELIDEIDHESVESAAIASGTEIDEQVQGAFNEIKKILVEMSVLEF